ncbi:glutathione peroxidase (plasmid) [Nicoliella spurrieriana]|uniref:Glutathione peroxidase n=1 Tax=Nicoliella spurrieriana TaxID=2925830 RepID=A0A976RQV2_9LACO|nr:glutathione peroxidase [Nicoliella spurrieriana]UQS86202.1 glutathione peroxidase [Nicoliella spurrieriana]
MSSIYDFTETEMSGQTLPLSQYKGKVMIIVNTASKCGLAGQLAELETLYKKYHQDGLEVVGFPSNQFKQELADDDQISEYCQMHYGVTFPMTNQVRVNGNDETPVFTYLKDESGHGRIKFNYTKFLIGRDGKLIHRYAPITKPSKMEPEIVEALYSKN